MADELDKQNESMMNNLFGNRRKMAFYSLWVIIGITLAVAIKMLYVPSTDVNAYASVLSWGISILGSVILSFIGAATFEQIKNPLPHPATLQNDKGDTK
jgi:hypothetical protein